MAKFILVHGAWVGSPVWRTIAAMLRRAGHDVYTPTLTGLGERRHLLHPGIDLEMHIRDLRELIEYEDLSGSVLVGHSYGGMVVSGVADAIPGRIGSLVLLDAFVPDNGDSLFDLLPPGMPRAATVPGTEWLTAPLPVESFGKPSAVVLEFSRRYRCPHPTACFTQAISLTGGIDRIRRRTYIYCNDPEPTTFTPIYEKLKSRPDWIIRTLPCTHMAQLDMPVELTAMLEQAVPNNP